MSTVTIEFDLETEAGKSQFKDYNDGIRAIKALRLFSVSLEEITDDAGEMNFPTVMVTQLQMVRYLFDLAIEDSYKDTD